jgi:cytidyltransferase-like protein
LLWCEIEIADTSVYCDGVFDLFHSGHAAFLKKVRALPDERSLRLLVGVISDTDARSYKRDQILPLADGFAVIEQRRMVDEAI